MDSSNTPQRDPARFWLITAIGLLLGGFLLVGIAAFSLGAVKIISQLSSGQDSDAKR